MPDPSKTIRDWPPPLDSAEAPTKPDVSPVVAVVLATALERLGQRETGKNQGAIVREVCAPFLSPERLERAYAAGKLEWCAAFACFCWRAGWPTMPRGMISLEVPLLWARLGDAKFARYAVCRRGCVDPLPGDLIFFSSKTDRSAPVHVGLVQHVGTPGPSGEQLGGLTLTTIEGNARVGDGTGEVARKHYACTDPRIWALVTLRPGA